MTPSALPLLRTLSAMAFVPIIKVVRGLCFGRAEGMGGDLGPSSFEAGASAQGGRRRCCLRRQAFFFAGPLSGGFCARR